VPPTSSMPRFGSWLSGCTAVLWLSTALASAEATPAATVLAGPWLTWTGRDYQIALLVDGPAAALDAVRLVRGDLPPQPSSENHPLPQGGTILSWTAPAPQNSARQNADPQPFTITLSPSRTRSGSVPPIPVDEAAATLAVVGTGAWPDAAHLERLGVALGAPIQAVLVLDALDLPQRIGSGGWEGHLPLIVLGTTPAALGPWLGSATGWFPNGLRWGALGLPVADDPQAAARALGQHKNLWTVPCAPASPWDPALIARPERRNPAALLPLIRLAHGLAVPLILGGGSLAGLLTDPLALSERGELTGRAGGTRFLLVPGLGDGLAEIGQDVAFSFDAPAVTGLAADEDRLLVAVLPRDRAEPTLAQWTSAAPAGAPQPGGPGGGDPAALAELVWAGLPSDPAPSAEALSAARSAAEALALMPHLGLRTLTLSADQWTRLLAAPAGSEQPADWQRALALRLLGDADLRVRVTPRLEQVPDWARRQVIQRMMSDPHEVVAAWLEPVAGGSDPILVRAAIVRAERSTAAADYAVLIERLRRQAAGTVAVDEDPLLQAQLVASVFTSPWLSPTPLRPIARDLAPRVGTLAQAELARFVARHGAERPVRAP
jgi:hypothetical protein